MGKNRNGGFSHTRGANPLPSVRDNLSRLQEEFPMTSAGWFGHKSEHKSDARIIESNDPDATAERFFRIASEGANLKRKGTGHRLAKFDDNTVVYYREASKSGGPAINISNKVGGVPKSQKIHFEPESKK